MGNEISALHNRIKPLSREGPNICKSSGFRVCMLLFSKKKKKKRGKNGADKAIRQENDDCVDISNLIHKNSYTFAHTPMCTYHCILLCGVQNEGWDASCDLVIF